jgi:hypothetical protein
MERERMAMEGIVKERREGGREEKEGEGKRERREKFWLKVTILGRRAEEA